MNQKERAVREKRTREAVKANLMGPAGKFGTIVKSLGYPIMRQSDVYLDVSFLSDPYEDDSDTEYEQTLSGQNGPVNYKDEILTTEAGVSHEGYVFDGLSRGMHIEIKYFKDTHRLIVNYKGFEVYKEVAGELESFAPFSDWTDMVDKLYKQAKKREKELKESEKTELMAQYRESKKTFWEKMRMRWGL